MGRKRIRKLHVFSLGQCDNTGRLSYLADHPEELSFPTALAAALNLDLSGFLPP